MKVRITRYPNNETRIALYPERFPKSLKQLCEEPLLPSPGSNSAPDRAFNIKSKVDTVQRSRRLGLSRNGRKQILRAGSCFDSSDSTERLLLTGTLPGTGNKAHRALAEFSSYASKTLSNWITRRAPSAAWQYVWEFQQRGALHIHFVVELPPSASEYVKAHFKDEWNRILRAICRLSGVDLYAKTSSYSHPNQKTQADVTICTREPSRYISKYISKSSTHAKAFGRFPPKTWYQVSRALLKRLRDSTVTYEKEGLSFRQSLKFIEDANHVLSQSALAGYRRFNGSVLAWSAYVYGDDFDIEEWGQNFMTTKQALVSTQTMHNQGITTLKNYPAARCYCRMINANANVNANANDNANEDEMLMTIQTIMQALTTSWLRMNNKTQAAMWLKSAFAWWESKFGSTPYTPQFRLEIDKICKEYLTA